jgi:signal transduction histidine kinase
VQLSVPIRDAAGKLNEVVGPITLSASWGLQELEELLHRMAGQISTIVERLQRSQREVLRAEQLAALGQLAAGMAHELRNPLMSMKLLVQSAAETGEAARLEGRDLQVLLDAISRVERSLQAFLDFARSPAPEKRTLDIGRVVEQTVQLVSGRAECQAVRIECDEAAAPVCIKADVGQVQQVLLNLLLNALDAMPRGGTVRIEWAVEEEPQSDGQPAPSDRAMEPALWLSLRVSDSGAGLPAGLGERIFEPFVTSKETGIGLGLPICRRIVEAHGGKIAAASRPEGGATFTIRLPFRDQEAQTGAESSGGPQGRLSIPSG